MCLRPRKVTLPYELMGGQAVLNARRALNSFAADWGGTFR